MSRQPLHLSSRIRLAAALSAAVLLVVLAAPAFATNRLANQGHWIRTNTAVAQVYFIDYTGTYWPVNAATIEWNRAAKLGAYYLTPSNSCPFHCVPIREVNLPNSGWFGATYGLWDIDSGKHFKSGSVYIQLNNSVTSSYGLTAGQRQGIACHEQGHAIGLEHREYTDDCMYSKDTRYFPRYPSAHDYSLVDAIYNH